MKYKVKYWISVDFLAEEGKYSDPSKNASYIVNDTIKITRRTFEEYDEKLNNNIKK